MNHDNYRLVSHPKLIEFADVPLALVNEAKAMILHAISATQEETVPRLVHLCGIPGSGKTTYARQFLAANENFALVQFDGVMANLSGYRRDCASAGLKDAFKTWELPARAIGYHLLQCLLENKRQILFDHSAAFRNHLELIDRAKEWGYVVEMHHMECAPEVARQRVRDREATIERHTPESYIWERLELLKELIPLYRAKVDVFRTISTTTKPVDEEIGS